MTRKLVLGGVLAICMMNAKAQTIFTYGKNAVSKEEFVKAFNKNPTPAPDRRKALREYLDLYVNFKLKVQAAYDAQLQNDPTQKYELENFRKQIADNIINDEAKVKDLAEEAFNRSKKDIHVQQVFIELTAKSDTLEAYKKIQAAYQALKTGRDFSRVAEEFSNDPFTRQSTGDLGFITVFTLPYEFETVAYNLQPGMYSLPFRSKIGYHIFKNVEERNGLGRRKVAQILISYPPGASDSEKAAARKKADSVYGVLQQGNIDFADLVKTVSNDVSTVNSDGQLTEFGVGQYSTPFEQAAFSLAKPGDLSKPFETNYGFHILKLIESKPVSTNYNDPETAIGFKDKILQDDRLTQSRKMLIDKRLGIIRYKPATYSQPALWEFTDSALSNRQPIASKGLSEKTVLFSFSKQQITAGDWIHFVRAIRGLQNELAKKDYTELMKEYVGITAGEYYRNHLEDYSPQFRQQVQEFKDANLLFGIMDKNVWSKANVDTVGLKAYYEANKRKYQWSPSAEALIITTGNEKLAQQLQAALKDSSANWRNITDRFGTAVSVDSGRFELSQLPVVDRTNFQPGIATAPVKNQTDNSTTFNYIFKVYPQTEQRSFDDARGMIISDYQQVLEQKWLEGLKKKYPVLINQAVFQTVK